MRSKDEKKELLILTKALEMIAQKGLSGLKMNTLAEEVGIAIGTIYIYFKDKEELLNALYVFLLKTEASQTLAIVETSISLQDSFEKTCFQYINHTIAHPEYLIFYEEYMRSPYYRSNESIQSIELAIFQPFYDEIVRGQQNGILKPIDPEILISMICGSLAELAKHFAQKPSKLTETYWKAIFCVIWDGIKA